MGIDIYMKWKGQTGDEAGRQITGFSVTSGHVGYLREAYHGEPYATKVLVPEAFEADGEGAHIPAAVLRSRLPETLLAAAEREQKVYKGEAQEGSPVLRAFVEFVELAERKEQETGEPVTIIASY